jgi:hypothetical protein
MKDRRRDVYLVPPILLVLWFSFFLTTEQDEQEKIR